MVYESDFYTTRRPYRASPSLSSYTVSTIVPSRQIRILPGIGKVHVVHSYERMIPYIGHKRITVVSAPSHKYRVRPSVIVRELDRISHKSRPYLYYSPSMVHSEPITFFDEEAKLIRLQSKSLMRSIHASVPRSYSSWPLTRFRYHVDGPLPARITSDDYIHRMLSPIQSVKQDIYNISHYYTEPIRRCIGSGHLACVRYGGDKAYSRRRNLTLQEIYAMQSDTVRNDIQMLSYYINANKDRKARESSGKASASLNSMRATRVFSKPLMMLEPSDEIKELRDQRAERFRKIQELDDKPAVAVENAGARIKRSTKKQEEDRLAEERAIAEEKAKKEQQAKKEEESRRAELARQEALAAQAAAERQAEIERKAELARQEELAKKAEEERAAEQARIEAEKAEQARIEAERKQVELAKQEEERLQLLRLEEIARQAEEEKEQELARQADELAELARQEAELAEQARKEAELAELAKQEAELAELERQEKELAELDRQEREANEAAKQAAELAEQEREDAEVAAHESNIPAEDESEPAIAEDEAEPVVEEPQTPEAASAASEAVAEEVTEEEEEEKEE